MHCCLLQTYRFTQLLVVFVFASITRQEFHTFIRLRRLCSDDSDFSEKSEGMCQFFDKRGYPVSVVQAGRQSALQTAEKENIDRIPFFLTFHPHNHAVKSIILKKF